jgi:zinc/manganese transport system substrate-binding protein
MRRIFAIGLFLISLLSNSAWAVVKVVASTTDLAAVAQEVGGELVSVESVCRGDQDPHEFEILPSRAAMLRNADVYLKVGLALDVWADKLIEGSGNSKLVVEDCSRGIAILSGTAQDPNSPHPLGNPHYWLGPTNLSIIGQTVRDALAKADPVDSAQFSIQYQYFVTRVDSAYAHWKDLLASCKGLGIISQHPEWDYFARDFGLEIVGTVSSMPEAEPSPVRMARLVHTITTREHCVFLREPFSSARITDALTNDTGIPVLVVPSSIGALPWSSDLWSQFDYLVNTIAGHCSGLTK